MHVDFLVTGGKREIFDDEAERLGARIYYVRYGRSQLGQFAMQCRRILREGRYDAIHDHSDYTSGWHFLFGVGHLPRVRVAHVHNSWLHIEANYAVGPFRKLVTAVGKRLVNLLATNVCGTSRQVLHQYGFDSRQSRGPSVSVVHCGIDVQKFSVPRERDRQSVLAEFGWQDQFKIVLFAGRLDRALEFDNPQNSKNSWFALNVLRAAFKKDESICLLMAGAGDASQIELNRHIDAWGLRDRFRLIGVRSDIPRLMRAADVLLFPSRQEGLGMVAVEAQAVGLPVLASTAVPRECVVIPELYDSLSLYEPIEQWADALLQRIHKPRPSLAHCSQVVKSSAFAIENSANRLEEIYGVDHP